MVTMVSNDMRYKLLDFGERERAGVNISYYRLRNTSGLDMFHTVGELQQVKLVW